jgi:lysophospholipase L1-like esterase
MRRFSKRVPVGARWVVAGAVAVLTSASSLLVALPGVSPAAATTRPYELTLGDSYAIGYQPGIGGTPGYTGYLAGKLGLQPENVGCGGATTTSLLHTAGCSDPASQHAVAYLGITQEAAALNFIAAHRGQVKLVTVSIGGNDFDSCSTAACVKAAMPTMGKNVRALVGSLNTALAKASDTNAKIIGLTYPDVDLGLFVYPTQPPSSASGSQGRQSILAFDDLINPTLKKAYLTVSRATFVDVTSAPYKAATKGDDTSFSITEQVAPYGTVPAAVGEVCQITYFCSQGNIHGDTAGYNFIGTLVLADYRS